MKKPKGVAIMRITVKPKGSYTLGDDDSPVDDDPDDDYDGPQEDKGHGAGMKEAMKLIQSLLGGGGEDESN